MIVGGPRVYWPTLNTLAWAPGPSKIADLLDYPGDNGELFDANDVLEHLRSKNGMAFEADSVIVEIHDAQEAIRNSL